LSVYVFSLGENATKGNKMSISRLRLAIVMMIVLVFAAACGGNTPPASNNQSQSTSEGPAVVAQAFIEDLYGGESVAGYICASAPGAAAAFEQAAEASAAGMANATVDTSGLTYTVTEETAERATVQVDGNIVYSASGVDAPVPFNVLIVLMNESGTWRICG
jgi:hypothetical protein